MSTIAELWGRLQQSTDFTQDELDNWIAHSDPSNHKNYFNCDSPKECCGFCAQFFTETYLNNPDPNVVPLRRKTRILLVMNNWALEKKMRASILDGLKNMTSIFEESMKKEGTMPFDSELGRMSEHILVLLMRVLSYKMKASQVHEFAEFNTQFAVQLLLAILLKEPPYEFELRCNCISGLLGFSQPQGFFDPSQAIDFNQCSVFADKVDFLCNLMLRLNAVQVVNDVVSPHLINYPTVTPQVHLAVVNMMRCVMNIFQFVTTGASMWREQLLTSTTFVDGVSILYIQGQVRAMESLFSMTGVRSPVLPNDVVSGLTTALKFMGFATFHMGRHAKGMRTLCPFIHDLLSMPLHTCAQNGQQMANLGSLYVNLLHFLCNTDALSGDDGLNDDDELIPQLTSQQLQDTIGNFLQHEVAPAGPQLFDLWHTKYYSVDTDALVSQDCITFQTIDSAFYNVKQSMQQQQQQQAPPPAPVSADGASGVQKSGSLLGDLPVVGKNQQRHAEKKQNAPSASSNQPPPATEHKFVVPQARKAAEQQGQQPGGGRYVCALNGHTLKIPVTSPYGHTFEKDTIESWLKQQGPVCPLTGKTLRIEDLQPNRELQNEIMQLVVQQSMGSYNQEDEADMYDF